MKTIYKYELPATDNPVINMPLGAKVLSAGVQGLDIYVWAEVNTEMKPVSRRFAVYGTGNQIPEDISDHKFIDTVFMGQFVWHIYER